LECGGYRRFLSFFLFYDIRGHMFVPIANWVRGTVMKEKKEKEKMNERKRKKESGGNRRTPKLFRKRLEAGG
jgi:hypothetical protein